jgi:hypothetical protein
MHSKQLIASTLIATAVTVNAQAAFQIAIYDKADTSCRGDINGVIRLPAVLSECESNIGRIGYTGCRDTMIMSCISDISAVPVNSLGNPFVIADTYTNTDCQGSLAGVSGFQANYMVNGSMYSCQPGISSIQSKVCVNGNCHVNETVEADKCLPAPQSDKPDLIPVKSVKYRCVSSTKFSSLSDGTKSGPVVSSIIGSLMALIFYSAL